MLCCGSTSARTVRSDWRVPCGATEARGSSSALPKSRTSTSCLWAEPGARCERHLIADQPKRHAERVSRQLAGRPGRCVACRARVGAAQQRTCRGRRRLAHDTRPLVAARPAALLALPMRAGRRRDGVCNSTPGSTPARVTYCRGGDSGRRSGSRACREHASTGSSSLSVVTFSLASVTRGLFLFCPPAACR